MWNIFKFYFFMFRSAKIVNCIGECNRISNFRPGRWELYQQFLNSKVSLKTLQTALQTLVWPCTFTVVIPVVLIYAVIYSCNHVHITSPRLFWEYSWCKASRPIEFCTLNWNCIEYIKFIKYIIYVLYIHTICHTIRKVNYIHYIHVNVDKVWCRTLPGSLKTVLWTRITTYSKFHQHYSMISDYEVFNFSERL